jgi:putative spermidine/putrescine transport system permease protein
LAARGRSLLQPALLPFWLLVLLPLAAGLFYALLYSLGLAGLLAQGFTLRHWGETLASREVWASLLLSLRVAATVVLFSAAAALWLARQLRCRLDGAFPAAWLYLPLVTPGLVAAFVAFQLFSGSGLAARLLATAGLIEGPGEMPELVLDPWAWGVVIAHSFLAIPFLLLLFHQLYKSERVEELRRLATSLGATPRQNLWRVEIPLLLRAAAGNLALLLVLVAGSYEVPLLLGRQSPQMLSVLILRHFSMFDLGQKPIAYALALLYTLVVVLALWVAWRRQAADES